MSTDIYAVNRLETSGIEHMQRGHMAEAERDLLAALEQRMKVHADNPDHPSLASALNNLAVLHLKQHRLDESAEGFRRVVQIKEELQRAQPTSRTALEIDAAKKNLATVERFLGLETPAAKVVAPTSVADPAAAAAGSAWSRLRGKGTEGLKSMARKNKEMVAKKLGIETRGKSEAEVDEAIRRNVTGEDKVADRDQLRKLIALAFDLLDEDGDGSLTRIEVLKGMRDKPEVRELLQMGEFTDPAVFDGVYRAIDTDGSNSIDRAEFEAYFLRKLDPDDPSNESAREREVRLKAAGAMKFMRAGATGREKRDDAERDEPHGEPAPHAPHYRLASSSALSAPESADISRYEEMVNSLEMSQRRKVALQADLASLQRELRTLDAEILEKSSAAERLRSSLHGHRSSHSSIAAQLGEQLNKIDHQRRIAMRPELRTADRVLQR
jgi:Ca2+-binding EF-hand superfamily protein